jgi:bifunctional non-homologous end joining protein LigD
MGADRGRDKGAELFQPMLASSGKEPPTGADWVYEPKYDGIRIVALVSERQIALMSRNGIDKCRQFPEVTRALRALADRADRNLVLDGEIVALDEAGEPARFQDLQGRMHLADTSAVEGLSSGQRVAFVAFDILIDGNELLAAEEWTERRASLERVMKKTPPSMRRLLRTSTVSDEPDDLMREARAHGWEGIMAKRRDCPYEPGRRVRHWQKLKIENQQEFVIGGWTEPRNSRKHFGALLLGYYDEGRLVYAGHTGTGFSNRLLDEVYAKLRKSERATSPFTTTPKTNERAHWVEPRHVAEIRFNEWTQGGNLRQPVFVGMRDDKPASAVVRERPKVAAATALRGRRGEGRGVRAAKKAATKRAPAKVGRAARGIDRAGAAVVQQLQANPKAKGLTLDLGGGQALDVTNLGKVFYPKKKVTKGQLLEYYARVAPVLLPALADRPLVLKRYPNGIEGQAFYQQKAPPEEQIPEGVRVERVTDEGIETERRLIGGNLATLLYVVQLGAISTDPWMSRVQSVGHADYSIVDLDPGPKATFKRVIQVARWVKEVLDELGLHAVPKTSGASGIHIVLPLPKGASYEISVALAELVARRVAEQHPKETTVHRWVKERPPAAVYVDYLQNIRGKTVASVYSARAEPHASVSAPLKWRELTDDLHPSDFTIENMPERIRRVGDLWSEGMRMINRLPGIVEGDGKGGAAA